MNITVDQYLRSLERSVRELPSVLSAWRTLDPDLCGEYADQLAWLLTAQPEVLAIAATQGRVADVAGRLVRANATLLALRDSIVDLMGVDVAPLATKSSAG